MSGANIAGRHRSFASTLVAKIIATSAAADSESANGNSFQSPGLRKSTTVDYAALDGSAAAGGGGGVGGGGEGVAVESLAKTVGVSGARFMIDKSALLAVDGAGVVSSPEESDDEEEEDEEESSDDGEDSSGEVEDHVEEEEDDDYRFTFDSESKEPTLMRIKSKSASKPKPKPSSQNEQIFRSRRRRQAPTAQRDYFIHCGGDGDGGRLCRGGRGVRHCI